jgi:hypothetical protein
LSYINKVIIIIKIKNIFHNILIAIAKSKYKPVRSNRQVNRIEYLEIMMGGIQHDWSWHNEPAKTKSTHKKIAIANMQKKYEVLKLKN